MFLTRKHLSERGIESFASNCLRYAVASSSHIHTKVHTKIGIESLCRLPLKFRTKMPHFKNYFDYIWHCLSNMRVAHSSATLLDNISLIYTTKMCRQASRLLGQDTNTIDEHTRARAWHNRARKSWKFICLECVLWVRLEFGTCRLRQLRTFDIINCRIATQEVTSNEIDSTTTTNLQFNCIDPNVEWIFMCH